MYSSELKRIYPFDNLTEGSVYLFHQIKHGAYLINPSHADVYIARKLVVTPQDSHAVSRE